MSQNYLKENNIDPKCQQIPRRKITDDKKCQGDSFRLECGMEEQNVCFENISVIIRFNNFDRSK